MTNNKKSLLNDLKFAALLLTCQSEALDEFLFQSFKLDWTFQYSSLQKSHQEKKQHLKSLVDVIGSEKNLRTSGHLTVTQLLSIVFFFST